MMSTLIANLWMIAMMYLWRIVARKMVNLRTISIERMFRWYQVFVPPPIPDASYLSDENQEL